LKELIAANAEELKTLLLIPVPKVIDLDKETINMMLDKFSQNKLPETIREKTSEVSFAKADEHSSGIVFESLEELCDALRVYDGALYVK
jgi:DNA-binding Xre family transcriptional regulator